MTLEEIIAQANYEASRARTLANDGHDIGSWEDLDAATKQFELEETLPIAQAIRRTDPENLGFIWLGHGCLECERVWSPGVPWAHAERACNSETVTRIYAPPNP